MFLLLMLLSAASETTNIRLHVPACNMMMLTSWSSSTLELYPRFRKHYVLITVLTNTNCFMTTACVKDNRNMLKMVLLILNIKGKNRCNGKQVSKIIHTVVG